MSRQSLLFERNSSFTTEKLIEKSSKNLYDKFLQILIIRYKRTQCNIYSVNGNLWYKKL